MKKAIFMIIMCVLLVFVLVACTADSPTPEPTPLETENPKEDNLLENTEDEPTEADIVKLDITGTWVLVGAQLADGTPWTFDNNDDIWWEITQDSAQLHWENNWGYGITEAVLSKTDAYQFLLSNKVHIFNGQEDPAIPVDSNLLYQPTTGLLRHWGVFSVNEGLDSLYLYFTRG